MQAVKAVYRAMLPPSLLVFFVVVIFILTYVCKAQCVVSHYKGARYTTGGLVTHSQACPHPRLSKVTKTLKRDFCLSWISGLLPGALVQISHRPTSAGWSMLAPWCEKANIVGRAVEELMSIGHHEILLVNT